MTNEHESSHLAVDSLEFAGYVVTSEHDPYDPPKLSSIYRAMSHALHAVITHDATSAEFGYDKHGSPVSQDHVFMVVAVKHEN